MKSLYFQRGALCEDILQFLSKVDPGQTTVHAMFMLQYNRMKIALAKVILLFSP